MEALTHRTQLLDRLWQYQQAEGFISQEAVKACAQDLHLSEIEIEGVISFYHFFHRKPAGKFIIYLNKSIISETKGYARIKEAFEKETGATLGGVDPSGLFGLYETACIGLSDQEPAALINFYPFVRLNTLKVRQIIAQLKQGVLPENICDEVADHIRYVPDGDKAIFFRDYHPGKSIQRLIDLSPEEAIATIKQSGLSGRGGAFFPTGLKWQLCRDQPAQPKYIVCNADEGEPGTFKDRVLMNALPGLMLEGMIIAGYAVGAEEGIIYLRAEYFWLKEKLERVIARFYRMGLLGKEPGGIANFQFDVRIQMGAGAYVCGEETALLNSMEGKRGEPRTKQYFPVERGFLNLPTIVNNVETLCAASRILELGVEKILQTGTPESPGTKVLSVSGDCLLPGIYEVEWGASIADLIEKCQADDPYFIQISGPSGECISMQEKDRSFSKEDLRCEGSVMIFNRQRDVLQILSNFADFFKSESCGICTPCRAGNFIIQRKLEKIQHGLAYEEDLEEIKKWGKIMQVASRCGLGKTATNSLVMSLAKFPEYFSTIIEKNADGLNWNFDIERATAEYERFKQ
ncbi:MAG TPA: NAD(P)H-dependent oxidoreductase subunit E [Saprospiraceae bacterium]|nr:NAD(P)H-dependent oxidoreductase subunit E [Saprospiraceae bacterium]HMQ83706.1 NAD(P)H-dependent oxidoreductase subunit E [Saprospiraceae bacterium]